MVLAKISVSGVQAVVTEMQNIPKGIIGGQIQLEFADPVWEGLNKTVVFQTRWKTKDIVNPGNRWKSLLRW